MASPAPPPSPWWTRRAYLVLLALLMAVPFLYPPVPPLADLPGHIGRYRVELDIARSPFLHRWFAIHWSWMGNLGVDLAVLPLARLIGLEPAVKLVVMAIPVMGAAGYLWIAREAHGRVPPTAAFALPLLLGYPFMFGFINYALAVSLALLALGLWMRLGRLERTWLRAALFVPISLLVWTAHSAGWAVLAIGCAGIELVRAWRVANPGWHAPFIAALAGLPLVPTLIVMLTWQHGGVAGATYNLFNWSQKGGWIQSALRDRWVFLDGHSVELLLLLVLLGLLRVLRLEARLLGATALFAAAYVLLPGTLLGAHYADMRLAPVLLAFALLALAPRADAPRWWPHVLAAGALGFLTLRIAAATASLALYSADYDRQLAATAHIPRGARLWVMVAPPCPRGWAAGRLDHLGSFALVRRDAFVNDQWAQPGAQPLEIRVPLAEPFRLDPSQIVRVPGCDRPEPLLADKLAAFPRASFDMVWLINVAAKDRPRDPGLIPVWANDATALYRIVH